MEVLRCMGQHLLCGWESLCFYEAAPGSGACHLIVKPELMEAVQSSASMTLIPKVPSNGYARNALVCSVCKRKVGAECNVGPHKEYYFCFDYKAVYLEANCQSSKWINVKSRFTKIETWTDERVFLSSSFDQHPLRVPGPADFENLHVSTLTCSRPRNYQIELFVQASVADSLIFLPTGTGKTLVSVMMVKFLKQLNKDKIGIFLGDRIPLVNQQAKVLMKEGNLLVKAVTGESSQSVLKPSTLKMMCSECDVLALTAQVFLNLLLNGFPVARCCCIVFDEAHHAVGRHPYAQIMKQVSLCPFESRPRILGLTASPAADADFQLTLCKVDDLSSIYCSASLLVPVLWKEDLDATFSEARTEYSIVRCTRAELKLHTDLWDYFFFLWTVLFRGLSYVTRRECGYDHNYRDFITRKPQNCWSSTCRSHLRDLIGKFCSEMERYSSRVLVERIFEILLLIDESTVHGVSSISRKQEMLKHWRNEDLGDCQLLERLLASRADVSSQLLSSRVEVLVEEVRSAIMDNASSRILVFVQTRYTARALEYVLERVPDIEKLRPSRLVGHSGFDGMTWEEEQKPILDRFRSGVVQLLISTSVLEEGIDVPSCNVVVRFDGMGTLTGTVQSRGRARLRGSRFVVILSDEEREKARTVQRMESNMHEAISRKVSPVSTSHTRLINYLVDQVQSVEKAGLEDEEEASELPSQQSFAVKVKFHDKWLTESSLKAVLRKYADVLKCDLRCSLVHLCPLEGQDTISTYESICLKGIPQLHQRSVGEHIWFRICSRSVDGDHTGSKTLQLVGLYAGVLKDPSTFVQVHGPELGSSQQKRAISRDGPWIRWDSQGEILCIYVPEEDIYLEFALAAIHGWVLLHHDKDLVSHRLYVPLRQAPEVYSLSTIPRNQRLCGDVEDGKRRQASLLNVMRDCLAFELLLKPGGKEEEMVYNKLLEYFENRGILVYDTIVKDIGSLGGSISLQEDGNAPNCPVENDIQSADIPECQPILPIGNIQRCPYFSTSYLMECIFSQYPCKFPRTTVPDDFYKELYEHEQDMQERILQAMVNSIDWFCNPLKLLQQAVRNLKPNTNLVPKNHIYVRHATITPSRVILYKPLLMKSSRLLRHFDPEKFLKVSFRDENMRFLPGKEYKLLSRVFRTLEKGLRVADRRYMFLGCSSSMLRSHSCWMTSLDPSEVRSWLGDFHDISCVGKYMARVGLGMSSTDETITVEDEEVDNPSVDVKQGNFCFSDGIGTISGLGLRRVLECLHTRENHSLHTVTAIQIRVAGYKGVLALDPKLTSADTQCRFRESMRKFPSSHRKLEVVNTSTSHPLYLNRQGIGLLSSLGVQDSTFETLQEQQLQTLLELFAEDQSEKAITRNCRALKLQPLLRAGMDIRTEPFLQQILSAVYFQKVQNLVTKTHIFVPDGRLLMGVLDETNSLDYGEIFVQICDSATNWKPQIVTGRCATYKNPCFHPGDVRVLRARDFDELRDLVNCVVFPAKGPRPHTNEMSGSDLDGDLYTVIWMPELIPADMHDPMLFDEEPPLEVPEVRETDMFAFFVKVIESAELSLIANSHLAFSDSKPDGARDPDCIELAKLHAKAVDFPKTGQQVVVRKDLLPTKFPDFMEKPERPSYPSQKVIGRLYRRAKCLFGDDLKRHVNVRLQPDSQLMFEGYIGHSDESKETYRDYCTLLRGLMQCYGVEQEAEIVTGCIVYMHNHLRSELFQWTQVVKQQFQELVQTFRNRFFDSVSCPEQRYSLASAWYMVAYTDDDENMRCLSFPWVISDVLAEIKHNKLGEGMVFMKDRVIHGQSLEEAVYHSMRADFIEQQPSKFASLLERRDLLEKVEVCVRARFKNASVKMFGSSCNFLFEPSVSDVDICVEVENVPAKRLSQIQVLDKLLPCLRQDFPGTCAIKDAVVPILKNDSGTLAFDITADGSGLRKSEMVLRYMSSHPSLLLVLTVLVKWARNVGLIASRSMGQFTPFTMAWLFIQFCLEEGYVPYIAFEEAQIRTRSSSYSTLNSVIEEVLDPVHNSQKGFLGGQLPGEVLLAFFRHYADLSTKSLSGATSSSPFRLPNPLEESKRPCVDLNLESFTVFRNKCLQAWHALTRTRNVKALYVLAQLHVCLRLSRFQSAVIRGAEEFYAQRLRSLTDGKASVRISPLSNSKASGTSERSRSGILLVEILGDPAAVQQIDQALRDLNNGRCWLPTTEHRVFVKGASFLLFEGSLSDQDRVGFVKYWGQAHLQHVYADLHVPVLVAKVGSSTWQAHAFSRLRSSLWRQRQCLLRSDSMSSATPVTALVRFGTLYVTNVPFDLGEQQSIGSVSIAELEDYTIRGKKYLHPDNISARYSSKPAEVETKRGPAAGDHPGKEEDYGEVDQDFHHHQNARGPERRKKPKESRPGASQSLFPHVHGSLDHLRIRLQKEGFRRLDQASEKYLVTLCAPMEYKVRLTSDLKFISLSLRTVRWLSGSLVFEREESKAHDQISSDSMSQQHRPNCVRFIIRNGRQVIEEGELRVRVRRHPVLEFDSSGSTGGEGIRVGAAFHGMVSFVRKVRKEIWLSRKDCLIVKLLDVTEWEGRTRGKNHFKSQKTRQEVELHMLDASAHLGGSDMAFEIFITRFWNSALRFKEAIF